jgi:hypothetical protein
MDWLDADPHAVVSDMAGPFEPPTSPPPFVASSLNERRNRLRCSGFDARRLPMRAAKLLVDELKPAGNNWLDPFLSAAGAFITAGDVDIPKKTARARPSSLPCVARSTSSTVTLV